MKTILKTLVIGFSCILMSQQLFAAPVGFLVVEKGIIKLRSNLQDRIHRMGTEEIQVEAGDEIQTGKTTQVRLYLNDKNESIRIYSNTFFKVSSVTEEESNVSMPIGKIRCLVKPTFNKLKNVRRKFRVRTVTAIIGVKGTDFVAQSDGGSTSLLTIEGVVGLASVEDPAVEVEVGRNQAAKAEKGEAPTPPVDVPPEAVETISESDTDAEWEGVEFGEPEISDDAAEAEEDIGVEEEVVPPLENLIPEEIDDVRDTVSEVQAGAVTEEAAAATEGTVIFTIEEQ